MGVVRCLWVFGGVCGFRGVCVFLLFINCLRACGKCLWGVAGCVCVCVCGCVCFLLWVLREHRVLPVVGLFCLNISWLLLGCCWFLLGLAGSLLGSYRYIGVGGFLAWYTAFLFGFVLGVLFVNIYSKRHEKLIEGSPFQFKVAEGME